MLNLIIAVVYAQWVAVGAVCCCESHWSGYPAVYSVYKCMDMQSCVCGLSVLCVGECVPGVYTIIMILVPSSPQLQGSLLTFLNVSETLVPLSSTTALSLSGLLVDGLSLWHHNIGCSCPCQPGMLGYTTSVFRDGILCRDT